jgi:hypothetical protein
MDASSTVLALCTLAFLGANVINVAAMLFQSFVLGRFVSEVSEIADEHCLERYRRVARLGMYLTLVSLPFLLVNFVCGLILVIAFGMFALVFVILANVVVFGIAKFSKGYELRARSLPAAEPFAAEYRRIGEVWVKKMLPDF